MTTITSVRIPELLQTLIDSRLDTIDRMLLGRLPRSERLEIVREVESQIFELLQERGSDEPTREDVLAVLARLDPPEAYLPEELGSEPATRPRPMVGHVRPAQPQVQPAGRARRQTALASGILGIATIVLLILIFPLVIGLRPCSTSGGLAPGPLVHAHGNRLHWQRHGDLAGGLFPSPGPLGHHGPCHRHHCPARFTGLRRARDVPLSRWNRPCDVGVESGICLALLSRLPEPPRSTPMTRLAPRIAPVG